MASYTASVYELMIAEPENFNIKEIKGLMERYSLPCSSICTMVSWKSNKSKRRNILDQDVEVRKRTMGYLKRCLQIGAELAAKLILFVPSGVANVSDR